MRLRHKPVKIACFTSGMSLVGRRVWNGVVAFARDRRDVIVQQWSLARLADPGFMAASGCDGVVMIDGRAGDFARLPRGLPAVTTSAYLKSAGIPRVCDDQRWLGELAAGYFTRRGFQTVAYCGYPFHHGSQLRGVGFAEAAGAARARVLVYEVKGSPEEDVAFNSAREQRRLRAWLRRLPKPCALLAFSDTLAGLVMQLALDEGLRLPEDVALLGIDNDMLLQRALPLGLSSIEIGSEKTGKKAAEVVLNWIRDETAPAAETLVRHARLVPRQTTDRHYTEDDFVAQALDFIHEHKTSAPTVMEIAAHMGCTRRTVERRFRAALGNSAHQVMQELRLERTQAYLLESQAPLKAVALACGFSNDRHLCTAFRQRFGMTPGGFRLSGTG
ncbi:helix-turn-helix domain-containing protein [Opitutaceae bacterium TAV4]|nr:helix-turn-helix domain-containing protein [Opitutaceae bacterium TAV4]RRJ98819.1 helix-turn-helix domain-containing protein [Opitutaceae bacterium TAV3]